MFSSLYIYTMTGLTEEERIELAALVEEEERLEREAVMMEKEVEREVEVEATADLDVSNVCDEKVQDTSVSEIEKVGDEKSLKVTVEGCAGEGKSVLQEISVVDNMEMAVITEMIVEEITTGLALKEGNDVIEIEREEETRKEEDGKEEDGKNEKEGEIEEGEKKEEEGERRDIKSVYQEPAVVETVFNSTEIAPGQYKSATFGNQNSEVVKEVVAEVQKEVVAEEMMNLSTNSISVTVDNLYGFQDQDDDTTMENEVNPMTNYVPPPPYPNPAPPRLSFISMENPLKMKQNIAPKNTPDRINDPFPALVPLIVTTTNMAANPNPTFFDVSMGGSKTNTDDEWDVDLLASSPLPIKVRNPCF
jgi:hypothetical protein